MCSGKTSVATALRNKLRYRKISLSEKIKKIESLLDTHSTENIVEIWAEDCPILKINYESWLRAVRIINEARKIERETPKPRKRYQFIGTNGGRYQISETIWVDVVKNIVSKDKHSIFVIDDVRFPNEITSFEEEGWLPIWLSVSRENQEKRLKALYGDFDPGILQHESEIALDSLEPTNLVDANQKLPEVVSNVIKIIMKEST